MRYNESVKKKYFPRITLSFWESIIFGLLILVTAGYIIYLKLPSKNKEVFVEASIQRADWWSSNVLTPTKLLDDIDNKSTDKDGQLTVSELRYFMGELKGWEYSPDNSFGIIRFKISADRRGDELFYKDQELLIGNPLDVNIGQTRLALLITRVQDNEFVDNYKHKLITVKVYQKREEIIKNFKKGVSFKDNNGFVYATITDLAVTKHNKSVTDQWGNVLEKLDPIFFDALIEIDMLVEENNNRLVGYDGRPITNAGRYIFNHPFLYNIDGWIIDVKDLPVSDN